MPSNIFTVSFKLQLILLILWPSSTIGTKDMNTYFGSVYKKVRVSHVFESGFVRSHLDCIQQCAAICKCASYNYKKSEDICEFVEVLITSTTQYSDQNFLHGKIKVNPMLSEDFPRSVLTTLHVNNGETNGDWHPPEFCRAGTFAVGYILQLEEEDLTDLSALNGISLACMTRDMGIKEWHVTSGMGEYGDWWKEYVTCQVRNGSIDFMTSFSLQVEPNQSNDCTGANFAKFMCRDYTRFSNEYELVVGEHDNLRGEWGRWSETCPINSAICGIKTRIESFSTFVSAFEDDTGLNDAIMYCCCL